MIRLAARTLRFRAGGFLAAFLAMLLGAAMVMACGGLMETGVRTSMEAGRLADADVVVAGDPGFDVPNMGYTAVLTERVRVEADLVDSIGAMPGVAEATGRVFDEPAPPGTVDAVVVMAAPDADVDRLREDIEAALPEGAVAYAGDRRGLAERPEALTGSEALVSLAGVFGAMALMVSLFGVASMLALSVRQRHRELALLRAVAAVWSSEKAADDAGIGNSRYNTTTDVLEHQQLSARDRWRDIDSPGGPIPALLPPAVVDGFEPPMGAVPGLGEHTDAVLRELGRATAEIAELRKAQVIGPEYGAVAA